MPSSTPTCFAAPTSCLQLGYFVKMLGRLATLGKDKKTPAAVRRVEREPWPEPSLEAVPAGGRTFWAYWHSGREGLPPFCRLCVRTWEAQNPGWTVVVLSDTNFRTYVAASDLPSTFESLKVQHRSDILRFAVLCRYGGIYMDASTVCLKSFEGLWNDASCPELMLAMPGWLECGTKVVNNAVIFARRPNSPYLECLQRRVNQYADKPCATLAEMRCDPAFGEWARHFDDPRMGVVADCMEYAAILWIMADCLVYEPSVREYVEAQVRVLPTFAWTHDFLCLPEPPADGVDSWELGFIVKMFWKYAPIHVLDDVSAAESIFRRVSIFKVSTLFALDWEQPEEWHLQNKTTMGRVLRRAADPASVEQATLDGVYSVPLPKDTVVKSEAAGCSCCRGSVAVENAALGA